MVVMKNMLKSKENLASNLYNKHLNKKFLTILSLISACMSRGIFAPILRKIIRTFFSDKTTNQILLILSYFGGIIRMVTSLFGILLFYNLIESFNFSSLLTISGITSALTSFMIITCMRGITLLISLTKVFLN